MLKISYATQQIPRILRCSEFYYYIFKDSLLEPVLCPMKPVRTFSRTSLISILILTPSHITCMPQVQNRV
jgi:hypothetical protein